MKRQAQLLIRQHHASSYSPRTYHNAMNADITIALACDFNTAGERLTRKAAGFRYLGVPLSTSPLEAARTICERLSLSGRTSSTINIAGNGLHTLHRKLGWSQREANSHVLHVLALVREEHPITRIISGGQTGIDLAGLVAASVLNIDAVGTLPKGFIQRFEDGRDVPRTEDEIRGEILAHAYDIRNEPANLLAPSVQHPGATQPQEEFDFGF